MESYVSNSGMIHANIPLDSIDDIQLKGSSGMSKIVLLTSDDLKHYIPCQCLGKPEFNELLNKIKGT